MQLWLVRHAVAIEQGEFDGPDAQRPLTPKGRRRFREFCDWLAGQTSMPQTILSSPLVRAMQTSAILAKSSGKKKADVTSTDLLSPGIDVQQLVDFARSRKATDCLALVGHEPDMSRILVELVGGGDFRFGKGFVAAVEFDSAPAVGAGRLCWFVGPKLPGPPPSIAKPYLCPCCGYRTISERGMYDICPVCFWEDDGQDEPDADVVRGGPHGSLSLTQARMNYRTFGACDERSVSNVRLPRPEEMP